MGESKNNPGSSQYTGPEQGFHIEPLLYHRLYPKVEWLDANKAALEGGGLESAMPVPTYDDLVLEISVGAGMVYPSALLSKKNWKRGEAVINVVARIPFAKFKAEIDAQIAEQGGPSVAANDTGEGAVEVGEVVPAGLKLVTP